MGGAKRLAQVAIAKMIGRNAVDKFAPLEVYVGDARFDSDAMRQYSEMLLAFARDYYSRLNEAIQNVDRYAPEAAKFLEAYASLKQDFEVWAGKAK